MDHIQRPLRSDELECGRSTGRWRLWGSNGQSDGGDQQHHKQAGGDAPEAKEGLPPRFGACGAVVPCTYAFQPVPGCGECCHWLKRAQLPTTAGGGQPSRSSPTTTAWFFPSAASVAKTGQVPMNSVMPRNEPTAEAVAM